MSIITSAMFGIVLNLVSNLMWEKIITKGDVDKIREIESQISEFNRDFDDTILDTAGFQLYINSEKFMSQAYSRIFKSYNQDNNSIEDFIEDLSKEAFEFVTQYNKSHELSNVKQSELYYKYFKGFINMLLQIRSDILDLSHSAQTSILTDEINKSEERSLSQIKKIVKEARQTDLKDNYFAEDRISKIIEMINDFYLSEAEKLVVDALEEQEFLSTKQRIFINYQKARVMYNKRKYDELDPIIKKIERLDSGSKYIAEIKYLIACQKKDNRLFDEAIAEFKKSDYSIEKILLKRVNYEINIGNISDANELITTNEGLIEDFKQFHEAHFYYGYILAIKNEYSSATAEFTIAYDKEKNIIYKYNMLITKGQALLSNERTYNNTENNGDVYEIVGELEKIEYILQFLEDEYITSYWMIRINLILIVDPPKAMKSIEAIDSGIANSKIIKSLEANVLVANSMNKEAKKILKEIWNYNLNNTYMYFSILANEGDWETIISYYEKLNDESFYNLPDILLMYIYAKYMKEGYNSVKTPITDLAVNNYMNKELVLRVLDVVLCNNDNEAYAAIYSKITNMKNSIQTDNLISISKLLLSNKKYSDTRMLIEDRVSENESMLRQYISACDNDEDPDVRNILYEKIKLLYKNGCRFKSLLLKRAHIEISNSRFPKAIQTLDEYKDLYGMDIEYAHSKTVAMYNNSSCDNLESEIEILLKTDVADYHLLVALTRARQGNWNDAQKIALRALFAAPEPISKEFLNNYIRMYMTNIEKHEGEVLYKTAKENSVVTLEGNENNRRIAIHIDQNLGIKSGVFMFDCENYIKDDKLSLILTLSANEGEKITLEGKEYITKEIIDIYTYFFRFCLSKLQTDYPDHGYFYSISAESPLEALEKLNSKMREMDEDTSKQLEMYNFGNNFGVPISYLSGKSIDHYSDVIAALLNKKNQHLYTGEVTTFQGREYVLTISSILVMARFGLLDKLTMISDRCVITADVEKSISEGAKESYKESKLQSGYIALTDDGDLAKYMFTIEDKKKKCAFWAQILQAISLSGIRIEQVEQPESDVYDIVSQYILNEDVASIELCRQTGRILVCDDLCIRKIFNTSTSTQDSTNIVGLINSEIAISKEETIDTIYKLSECKYLYATNADMLFECYKWLFSISDAEEFQFYFDKLKKIFSNMLDSASINYCFGIYQELFLMTQAAGISSLGIYELVREPLNLKPLSDIFL